MVIVVVVVVVAIVVVCFSLFVVGCLVDWSLVGCWLLFGRWLVGCYLV